MTPTRAGVFHLEATPHLHFTDGHWPLCQRRCHVRLWHESDMPTIAGGVRLLKYIGLDLLPMSSSVDDPTETSRLQTALRR
jgi:hypothetical protein